MCCAPLTRAVRLCDGVEPDNRTSRTTSRSSSFSQRIEQRRAARMHPFYTCEHTRTIVCRCCFLICASSLLCALVLLLVYGCTLKMSLITWAKFLPLLVQSIALGLRTPMSRKLLLRSCSSSLSLVKSQVIQASTGRL